ncbi:MAG: DUF4345 domain-containing protein [bacterium]|nr:DUF4345 domain-containing protein [bacterium]
MNARLVTAVVGTLTILFGLAGLFYPAIVMSFANLSPVTESMRAAALGEVRAIYGGTFTVLGAFTLRCATNPSLHRGMLLMISILWLGIFGGRMVGVVIDGNPGLLPWAGAALEILAGGLLLMAAMSPAEPDPAQGPPL